MKDLELNCDFLAADRIAMGGNETHSTVANCATHVDALAAALETIVDDYIHYRAINAIDMTDDHCANLDKKMGAAIATLAAYRIKK